MFELLITIAALLPQTNVWHDHNGAGVAIERGGKGYGVWVEKGELRAGAYNVYFGDSI